MQLLERLQRLENVGSWVRLENCVKVAINSSLSDNKAKAWLKENGQLLEQEI